MKWLLITGLMLFRLAAFAQADEQKLERTMREFHQALVTANTVSINQQTDKALSYGHSNGWVESKNELIRNLETGVIKYVSYREDSVKVVVNGNLAHARFNADISATMQDKTDTFHLKVLEVWVKKGSRWILFARQAVKKL